MQCWNCDSTDFIRSGTGEYYTCRQCYRRFPGEEEEKKETVPITPTDDAPKMGFIKHDGGKPSWSTMPQFEMLDEVAQVGSAGAKKYALYNWQKADKLTRYIDAAYRHLNAFAWRHEDKNEADFGLSHLAHAVWCLLTVMWMMKYRPKTDDRFKRE